MTYRDITEINTTLDLLLGEVADERLNQIEQWGKQDHPSSFGPGARREFARSAQKWKDINDARVQAGKLSWDGILLEEVFEALESDDDNHRATELIQVAAVAIAEVEAIRRRQGEVPIEEGDELSLSDCPVTRETCDQECLLDGPCHRELDEADTEDEDDEPESYKVKNFSGETIRTVTDPTRGE